MGTGIEFLSVQGFVVDAREMQKSYCENYL